MFLSDFLNSLTLSLTLSLSLFLSLSCTYALSLSLSLSLKAGCLIVMMSAASLFAFCRQRANGHRWGFSRFASFHSSLSRTLSLRSISISLSLSLSLSLSWHHRDRIQRSFDQRELWEGFAFSLIFTLLVFASAKNVSKHLRSIPKINSTQRWSFKWKDKIPTFLRSRYFSRKVIFTGVDDNTSFSELRTFELETWLLWSMLSPLYPLLTGSEPAWVPRNK